ncbi:MAG: hypothetical protein JJT94_02685 [Bernardetiaceae bacterium]|nr:hypothetical protein [Bernardetiaceae bacterium]
MKQVFKNPFGLFYDLEAEDISHCLLAYWKGFYELNNPKAIEALNFCLDYVEQHQIKVLISDHAEVEVLPQAMLDYLDNTWYPRIIGGGLKVEIYVDSQDFTGSLSIEEMFLKVNEKASELVTIKVQDVEEALKQAQHFVRVLQEIE